MADREVRGRRAFVVEGEWIVRRPEGGTLPVVVVLHGYGETPDEMAERLADVDLPGAALLFAGGPLPVEVRDRERGGRRIGRAWYAYDGDQERFRDALDDAEAYLDDVLADAARKADLDPTRIAVVGYSMGAYLGGTWALRRTPAPRALALVSGRLKHEFLAGREETARDLPVLVLEGRSEDRIPAGPAEEGRRWLERAGARLEHHVHEGGHEMGAPAVAKLRSWLRGIVF